VAASRHGPQRFLGNEVRELEGRPSSGPLLAALPLAHEPWCDVETAGEHGSEIATTGSFSDTPMVRKKKIFHIRKRAGLDWRIYSFCYIREMRQVKALSSRHRLRQFAPLARGLSAEKK
jgi:hypothetical protein